MLPHKNPIPIVYRDARIGRRQPEGHGLSGGSPASAKSNVVFRSSNVPRAVRGRASSRTRPTA